MRVARGVALLVVSVLTSVGTASGAGRWLLWVTDGDAREIASFNAESECRAEALRSARSRAVEEAGKPRIEHGDVWLLGTEVHVPAHFERRIIFYECLPDYVDARTGRYKDWKAPDTIDPSGSKAK